MREAAIASHESREAFGNIGYCEDPRELHEFPEVCRYVRRFARTARLDDWQAVPWVDPAWGVGVPGGMGGVCWRRS
jgi:hypothetical protein